MKILQLLFTFIAIFLFSPSITKAGEIHLTWDAHPESTVANPVNFRIEAANIITPNTWVSFDSGIQTDKILTGLAPGKYLFRALAVLGGVESLPSDILQEDIKPITPGKPRKKVALQTSTDLKQWSDLYVYTDESTSNRFYRIGVSVN